MDDATWPPPPDGRQSTPEHIKLPGVDIIREDDALTFNFAAYRRYLIGFSIYMGALSTLKLLLPFFDVHTLSGYVGYMRVKHHYMSIGSLFPLFASLGTIYTIASGHGIFKVGSIGAVRVGGRSGKIWHGVRYTRISAAPRGRWNVCLGLPGDVNVYGTFGRPLNCERYEVALPQVKEYDTARRIADMIGDLLSVETIA